MFSFALISESYAFIRERFALIHEKYNFIPYENELNVLSYLNYICQWSKLKELKYILGLST